MVMYSLLENAKRNFFFFKNTGYNYREMNFKNEK